MWIQLLALSSTLFSMISCERMVYDEDFSSPVPKLLSEHKYQVYLDGVHAYDHDNPKITERFYPEQNGGMRFRRKQGDEEPFGIPSLNTRFEMAPGIRPPANQHLHLHARIGFDLLDFESTFLQIGYVTYPDNKTKIPLLSLETRDRAHKKGRTDTAEHIHLNVRCRFRANGEEVLHRIKLMDYKKDVFGKVLDFDIFFLADEHNGYVYVYIDNKLMFSKSNVKTSWASDGRLKLQYGLYATDYTTKMNQMVLYRYKIISSPGLSVSLKPDCKPTECDENKNEQPLHIDSVSGEDDKVYINQFVKIDEKFYHMMLVEASKYK